MLQGVLRHVVQCLAEVRAMQVQQSCVSYMLIKSTEETLMWRTSLLQQRSKHPLHDQRSCWWRVLIHTASHTKRFGYREISDPSIELHDLRIARRLRCECGSHNRVEEFRVLPRPYMV